MSYFKQSNKLSKSLFSNIFILESIAYGIFGETVYYGTFL